MDFGDNVRVVTTPETSKLNLAGLTGRVDGWTTPSVTGVEVIESDLFDNVEGSFDLIVSNPPYLVDQKQRLYRHGGGEFGSGLSLKIVERAVTRLAPGGRLVLYTGSAIVNGIDRFEQSLRAMLRDRNVRWDYQEIDPDVFGEELDHAPYDRADRIAVVGVIVDRIT